MGDIKKPDRHPVWRGIGRTLAVTLVFVVLGPPIGAATLFGCMTALSMARSLDPSGLGWIGLFALLYGVPMSYLIGAPTAALAGVALGLGRAFGRWTSWTPAVLTGAVVGLPMVKSSAPLDLMFIAVCLVPTLVCWWIARRLVPSDRDPAH